MKNPHTLLPATRALLAAFLLAGAGAGITRSAEYTVAPGGSLPSTGVIAASDTITLQGDVAVPASYQLAAKLVLIRSSDPDTPRTITFTSATPTYFFRITSTGVWGFDNIIITGGNSNGTSYGGAITFHHSVAGANTIAGKFTATNNYGILGGGVYTHAAAVDLVFTDTVRFLNNTGRDGGGAVYAKGNLEFKDSAYFEGNYGNGGGAVRLPTNSKSLLLAKNAVFVSNTSPGHAGAILLQGDYYIGGSSTFANNTASGTSNYGGAIFMFTQDNVTATGTLDATLGDITFTGNTHRDGQPNAIYLRTGATAISNLIFNTGAGAGAHAIEFYDPIGSYTTASGSIAQNGAGTVLFDTHVSDIAAQTFINSGTLKLTRGAIFGHDNATGSLTLAAPATLSANGTVRAATITLANGATLEVLGAGKLTLAATTRAYGSNLHLLGSGTLDAGAALSAASVSVGTLAPADPVAPPAPAPANSPQTLALAAGTPLILENGGVIHLDLFAGGVSDRLDAAGSLTLAGTGTVNLTGASDGSYKIITTANDLSAASLARTVNGAPVTARYTAGLRYENAGTETWVDFAVKNLAQTWAGGGTVWQNSLTAGAHWTDGAATTPDAFFRNGDLVAFTGPGAGAIAIDAAGVVVSGMTVDTAADYTFAGPGGITSGTTGATANLAPLATGKLVKTGAGALNFANAAANTFAEGIDISGGVIGFTAASQLGDGGNGIRFTGDAALRANAAGLTLASKLIVDAAVTATLDTAGNTLTYAGDLSGVAVTGTLAKTGAGTLKLTTDHSAFAARTLVNQGILSLDTAASRLGGRIDIAAGATLAGIGVATGSVFAAPGAVIQIGATNTAPETFAINNLALDSGIIRFDLFAGNASDRLDITGTLAATGTNIIDLSSFTPGAYNLGNIAGLGTAQVRIGGLAQPLGARQTAAISGSADGNLYLVAGADMSRTLRWTGSTSAIWTSADSNWTDGGDVTLFAGGDRVIFDSATDAASPANRSIDIAGAGVTVSDLQMEGSGNYTLAGAGITADAASVVSGTLAGAQGKLVKTGGGTLALANAANTFKGGIELSGGAVTFTAGNQLGDGGNGIHFTGNATLAPAAGALTLANDITVDAGKTATIDTGADTLAFLSGTTGGAGTILKTGGGMLVYSTAGALGHAATAIAAGVVRLDAPGLPAASGSHAFILDGGWLDLSGAAGGAFDVTGSTAADWSGLVLSGTVGRVIGANDKITLRAGAAGFDIGSPDDPAKQGVFVVVDAGPGGVATMGGANSYAGCTLLKSGTLRVSSDAQLGLAGGDVYRELVFDGGALAVTTDGFASARTIELRAGGGAVDVPAALSATLSGAVAGAGVLVKNGAGALTLAGDASSAAGLVINSGTLSGDTARLPSAIANHGHLVLNQIAGGAFTGTLTGAAGVITKAGAGALSLPGAVSAAVLNLDAGTLVVPGGRVLGVAQFNNRGILRVGKAGGDTAAGTVTIAGNYTGAAGAQLFLDLNISGTSLSCDRLRIGGDVDGVTTVAFGSVVSRNPLPGDSFLPADIISWDGGAAAGAFVQAECSVIEFGGAQYTWRVNAAGTGGEWVADAISSAPAMLGADAVALIAGKAALASLGRRMRYERLENRPHTLELWLNNARRHDTITSSAYAGARVSTEGLQLGGDWGGGTTGDGFRALGLFYERAESRLRLPGGVAKTRSESDGGGLYYTERAGAWFTDVVLRYAMADYFVAVPERPEFTTKGETFGYSAEVGRLVTLPGKWILQPSVQVASQRMEIATTTDAFGRTYRVNDTDSIELRAGAGISRDFEWRPKKALTLYARAGCAHEFDGETELHVAGHINRRNSLGGDAALLDAGAFMRVSNHLGASAEAAFWTGNRMRGFSLDLSLSCAW